PEVARRGFSAVWGRNSRYSFDLKRSSETAPYLILDMLKADAPAERFGDACLTNSVQAPWRVFDKPLRQWLTTPHFTLKSVRPATVDGKLLARLDIEYANPEDVRRTAFPAFSGELLLAPKRNWCICQVNCVMHHIKDGQVVTNLPSLRFTDFGPPVDNYPMPKIVRGQIKGDPASKTKNYLCTDT